MQTVTRQIGEFEYEISKPLAEQGLEFSLAIGKMIVPFTLQLQAAMATKDIGQIMKAAGQVLMSLSPEDLKYVNKTLGELTQVHHNDGRIQVLKRDVFLQHFQDRFDEWITWVVFGVQTVCGSFFVGALGLGAMLKKKSESPEEKIPTDTKSKSPSPVERTG